MQRTGQGYAAALMATVIWSGNFVVARAVAAMIPPWQCNFWRWLTALAILLPFAWKYLPADWPHIRAHWRYLTLQAILGVTLMNTLIYKAGQTTESLNMALLVPTAPVVILLLSRILYGEPISPRRLALCAGAALRPAIHAGRGAPSAAAAGKHARDCFRPLYRHRLLFSLFLALDTGH